MFPMYDINYEEFIGFMMKFSNELDFNFNNFSFHTEEIKSSESNLIVYLKLNILKITTK